jgi:hypothetical protein
MRRDHGSREGDHAAITEHPHAPVRTEQPNLIILREEPAMSQTPQAPDFVRIELTKEQKEQVKETTGKDGAVLELTVKELEERIAPLRAQW